MKKTILLFTLAASVALFCSFQRATSTLKIMVLDNLGKVQEEVRIRLYTNKTDYEKDQNFIAEQMTNSNGNAQFGELRNQSYYVSAVKGDKDNSSNGVITETLRDDKLNKMKLIISD
jgi:uncharacterized protein (DUF2141 family)